MRLREVVTATSDKVSYVWRSLERQVVEILDISRCRPPCAAPACLRCFPASPTRRRWLESEQNRHHIAVLERAIKLGYVDLPRRIVAIKPTFINIVLVSKEGSIGRPRKKTPELNAIVKVDQFRTQLLNRNVSSISALKLVGSGTLKRFGHQLVALHQPAERDRAKRFGINEPAQVATGPVEPPPPPAPASSAVCARCGLAVSAAEVRFCRFNKARFDGQLYCMPCQQVVAPLAKRAR